MAATVGAGTAARTLTGGAAALLAAICSLASLRSFLRIRIGPASCWPSTPFWCLFAPRGFFRSFRQLRRLLPLFGVPTSGPLRLGSDPRLPRRRLQRGAQRLPRSWDGVSWRVSLLSQRAPLCLWIPFLGS